MLLPLLTPLPPSTFKLPLLNNAPPLHIQLLPPSNVPVSQHDQLNMLPPFNDPSPLSLPLPNTMLHPLLIPLPPFPRHRTCESSGLEAPMNPLQIFRAQLIRRQWPSGATACLSRVCCDAIVHATRGQLAPEYLHRTVPKMGTFLLRNFVLSAHGS